MNLSPISRGSLHSFGIDLVSNSRKFVSISFQLFGAVIQTEKPVENGLQGNACTCTGDKCQCKEPRQMRILTCESICAYVLYRYAYI